MSKQLESLNDAYEAKQKALLKEFLDNAMMINGWKGPSVEQLRGASEIFARLSTRQAKLDVMRGMIQEVVKATESTK